MRHGLGAAMTARRLLSSRAICSASGVNRSAAAAQLHLRRTGAVAAGVGRPTATSRGFASTEAEEEPRWGDSVCVYWSLRFSAVKYRRRDAKLRFTYFNPVTRFKNPLA